MTAGGKRPGAGAPFGERNGRWIDGRYSRAARDRRRAACRAEFEASKAWQLKAPKTDYSKIIPELQALRRGRGFD
jgi:hypothetical protein